MVQITIIVPVYNAHLTLSRCIDSILKQSFKDFELLLINDGSCDNSLEICRYYANIDTRVKYFSQENCGVSSARNKGIEYSTGKYVCFVDADDEVDVDYLNSLISKVHGDSFLILQGVKKISKEKKILSIKQFPNKCINSCDFEELFSIYDISKYGYPFSKLYILNIIKQHHIYFRKEITFSEDLIFMLDYLSYVDEVIMSNDINYLYYDTMGSLTKQVIAYEVEFEILNVFINSLANLAKRKNLDLNRLLKSSNISLSVFLERILLSIFWGRYSKNQRVSFLRQFYDEYGKCLKDYLKNSRLNYILNQLSYKHYMYVDLLMRTYMFGKHVKNSIYK